jgi:ABC-type nitrate/sulfonate/bicarbonate transport system permease component
MAGGAVTTVASSPRVPARASAGSASRIALRRMAMPLIGVATLLAAWQATVHFYALPKVVLPTPWQVAAALADLVVTAAFWRSVGVSLYEFAIGYAFGVLLGVAVGALMAESRLVRLTIGPVVEAFRFVVPFAWIPLTVLWFGTSLVGKIVLVAYAVFFVMAVSTMRSMWTVEPTLTRVGRMLGMGRVALALGVHLRAAAPGIASAARAAAAIGWIAVVAAEYIGSSAGLGFMITNAAMSLATGVVIAGMIVIGLIGAGVSAMIDWLSRTRLAYR